MGPYINNHMKYIALMLCVLFSSCMTIPTVTTKPAVQPIHLEPVTSDTFSQADTDNDGKLTQAEAKNLEGDKSEVDGVRARIQVLW